MGSRGSNLGNKRQAPQRDRPAHGGLRHKQPSPLPRINNLSGQLWELPSTFIYHHKTMEITDLTVTTSSCFLVLWAFFTVLFHLGNDNE